MTRSVPLCVHATAPAKVILFGEHAINRGQPAVATAVGLYAQCKLTVEGSYFLLRGGGKQAFFSREEVLSLTHQIEDMRKHEKYDDIRRIKFDNYFAPALYLLGHAFGDSLPQGLHIEWQSSIPASSGLGSGGAAFTALAAAVAPLLQAENDLLRRADWAHHGDIVAHGGIASALDTQTSLLGGVIGYSGKGLARSLPFASGLDLIIANTGVNAATAEVNRALKQREAENPRRFKTYFETIGELARSAEPLLAQGDWQQLGHLLWLNQLVLEKVGVSCSEIETLVRVALDAGAYGAKLAGSGGGGIVIALVSPAVKEAVISALRETGAEIHAPSIGVEGAKIEKIEEKR